MKIRINEYYHFWYCDWCDSENRVLWTKIQDGASCGACHRSMTLSTIDVMAGERTMAMGLC